MSSKTVWRSLCGPKLCFQCCWQFLFWSRFWTGVCRILWDWLADSRQCERDSLWRYRRCLSGLRSVLHWKTVATCQQKERNLQDALLQNALKVCLIWRVWAMTVRAKPRTRLVKSMHNWATLQIVLALWLAKQMEDSKAGKIQASTELWTSDVDLSFSLP